MASNKKRKTWCPDAMKKAYFAVKNNEMGYLRASKIYGVPKSTLEDYIKKNADIDELLQGKLGRKPTFHKGIEDELVKYCLEMVNRYYGLRASDIRVMAFQLAIKNNIAHQFSDKGRAGKKWLSAFLKRHPQLSFRTPEATTALRAKGFTKEKVSYFFDILKPELAKVNHDPTRIFNVDETGVTVVQSRMAKVICLKGQKQVGGISSAERGSLVSLVFCMSAAGLYVPPMFVFPRVNMKKELEDRAPPGSIFAAHKSGWIQLDLFTKWFKHFVDYVKPTKETPILLLLDGHFSHTRNLELIEIARENGVILVSIPPHSSHKLQPLDVGFMAPFKTYYAQEIETWLRSHPGRVVTTYQISELVGKAYLRTASADIAVNAFLKCGIYPRNENIFRDCDFAVNSQEVNNDMVAITDNEISVIATINDSNSTMNSTVKRPLTPQPSTSREEALYATTVLTPKTNAPSSKLLISPEMIKPVPSIDKKPGKENSRQTKPTVLTASPYKQELKNAVGKKNKCLTKKKTAKVVQKITGKRVKKVKSHKRKTSESETDESDIEMILESDGDSGNDDVECSYCNEPYSNDIHGEKWIRCIACYKWCHELCADINDAKIIDFICDFCIQG